MGAGKDAGEMDGELAETVDVKVKGVHVEG